MSVPLIPSGWSTQGINQECFYSAVKLKVKRAAADEGTEDATDASSLEHGVKVSAESGSVCQI